MQGRNKYMTSICFSRSGDLSSYSVYRSDWDAHQETPWIIWRLENEPGVYEIRRPRVLLKPEETALHFQNLHPILRNFLKQDGDKINPLELLLSIKSAEIKNAGQLSDISLGHAGMRRSAFSPPAPEVTTDQAIAFLRKRNKTYLQDFEIREAVNKISARFKDSLLTTKKTAILNDFVTFYDKNKDNICSRVKLVKEWVRQYQVQYRDYDPFEALRIQRRDGCLRVFNPAETDSIKFFKKFMNGETIPDNLANMLSPILETQKISNAHNRSTYMSLD